TDWQSVTASGNRIAAVAAGPGRPPAVVLTGGGRTDVLWTTPGVPAGHLPPPVHRTYAGVHAYVYEPCHPRVTGPPGENPPY
ncbi:S9 family peptidase, partial [Escherichia coli]|nr:S9 family peptidase [Escherichia coli]